MHLDEVNDLRLNLGIRQASLFAGFCKNYWKLGGRMRHASRKNPFNCAVPSGQRHGSRIFSFVCLTLLDLPNMGISSCTKSGLGSNQLQVASPSSLPSDIIRLAKEKPLQPEIIRGQIQPNAYHNLLENIPSSTSVVNHLILIRPSCTLLA